MLAVLEVRGRVSGRWRNTPVVIATLGNRQYLVSMLGEGSDWVRNVDAAHGRAEIRHGGRYSVRLSLVPAGNRAPILREYVRVATSGRRHLPVKVDAPLKEFEAIAEEYPVDQINLDF